MVFREALVLQDWSFDRRVYHGVHEDELDQALRALVTQVLEGSAALVLLWFTDQDERLVVLLARVELAKAAMSGAEAKEPL